MWKDILARLSEILPKPSFTTLIADAPPPVNVCNVCGGDVFTDGVLCNECYEQAGMVSLIARADDDLWEFMTGEEPE